MVDDILVLNESEYPLSIHHAHALFGTFSLAAAIVDLFYILPNKGTYPQGQCYGEMLP